MRRLIVGPIPKDYDSSRDVPLGIHCFAGHEAEFDKYEKDLCINSSLYASVDRMEEVVREANGYIFSLLEELTDELNRANNTHYSIKFWRVLMLPWLLHVVHIALDYYYQVLSAKDYFKDEVITVRVLEKKFTPKLKSLDDFVYNGIYDARLHYWMISYIIEYLKFDAWHIEYEALPLRSDHKMKYDLPKAKFMRRFAMGLLQRVPFRVGMKLPFLFEILCSLILVVKSLFAKKGPVDFEDLEPVKPIDPPSFVKEIVYSLLPQSLSAIPIQSTAFKLSRWCVVGSNLAFLGNEKQRLIYACLYESGVAIYGAQHGSMYGVSRVNVLLKLCEYSYQGFFTWGWKDYNRHKIGIPMECPLVKRSKNISNSILFISHCILMNNIRIESSLRSGACSRYLDDKKRFFNELDEKLLQNVRYRTYPLPLFENQFFFDEKKWIKKTCPNVTLSSAPFKTERSQSSLVIMDYPGTEFYKTIGSNIPCIGYWDPVQWAFSEEAKAHFDLLKKAEIIFDNPIDAANKLNAIGDDIEGWWNTVDVQVAVKAFSQQYSRRSKWWWFSWLKELCKIK